MAKFSIKVTSLQTSEVTNNVTGKTYVCRNEWHKRLIKGIMHFEIYVDVKNVEGKAMKDKFTLPFKFAIKDNGKLDGESPVGKIIESDLAGKQRAIPTMDMFD